MIMYQLKPFKRYIYYRNNQLDGMNIDCEISDNNYCTGIMRSLMDIMPNMRKSIYKVSE